MTKFKELDGRKPFIHNEKIIGKIVGIRME